MSQKSRGYSGLSGKRIVVLGVVKDVEKNLQVNLDSIEGALTGCELSWVIVESNSKDKTREILKKNSLAKDSFHYEALDTGTGRPRLEALANAREHALQIARKLTPPPQLVLVIDLDQNYKWEEVQFPSLPNGIDAVFAHQEPYYDLLAFRPTKKWADVNRYKFNPQNSFVRKIWNQVLIIPTWQLRLGRLREPMEVRSAFGGAAIYSYDTYVSGHYVSSRTIPQKFYACEHVIFHDSLSQKGANLVVDPNFCLPVKNEHSPIANLVSKIRKLGSRK